MNKVSQKQKVTVTERENLNGFGGGVKNVKPKGVAVVPKRPAFGELGNKIQTATKCDVTKKTVKPKIVDQKKDVPVGAKKNIKNDPIQKDDKKVNKNCIDEKNNEATKHQSDKIIANKNEKKAFSSLRIIGSVDVNVSDPFLEPEYREDIFKYLLELESTYSINVSFLKSHPSTPRMRSILINWIVEVHTNFHFLSETLHLTVTLIDHYLQMDREIGRENLQLVGITALLIASKYEEMYIPDLNDFAYVCDNAYKVKEILEMEMNMLKKLDFALSYPTAVPFLRWFSRTAQIPPLCYTLGKYISELVLNFYQFCHVKPSMRAAAACCLSMSILEEIKDPSQTWTENLVECSTYKYGDIEEVVIDMATLLSKIETSDYQVIYKKYATAKNGKISLNPKLKKNISSILSHVRK